MRSAKRRKTERWHLPPRTGALCWRRKANRPLHREHSKYSVALIGDLFTDLPGDRALDEKKRRIWSRNFLHVCSNTEIWTRFGAKRDVCVLTCLCPSNVSSQPSGIAPAALSGTRAVRISRWTNYSRRKSPTLSWRKPGPLIGFTSGTGRWQCWNKCSVDLSRSTERRATRCCSTG